MPGRKDLAYRILQTLLIYKNYPSPLIGSILCAILNQEERQDGDTTSQ